MMPLFMTAVGLLPDVTAVSNVTSRTEYEVSFHSEFGGDDGEDRRSDTLAVNPMASSDFPICRVHDRQIARDVLYSQKLADIIL